MMIPLLLGAFRAGEASPRQSLCHFIRKKKCYFRVLKYLNCFEYMLKSTPAGLYKGNDVLDLIS